MKVRRFYIGAASRLPTSAIRSWRTYMDGALFNLAQTRKPSRVR
jgi:hypothetical protein